MAGATRHESNESGAEKPKRPIRRDRHANAALGPAPRPVLPSVGSLRLDPGTVAAGCAFEAASCCVEGALELATVRPLTLIGGLDGAEWVVLVGDLVSGTELDHELRGGVPEAPGALVLGPWPQHLGQECWGRVTAARRATA
jgi:hypothetical protein